MYNETTVKEIDIREIKGLRIGNAEDPEAKTGVTVLIFHHGATVGVDVSGGGPASRENMLADPLTADNPINAIVLSGGSAYGLAASDGVMRYLESRGIGYDTGFAKVPLVCQACIYDLGIGRADVRPDAQMGYDACKDSEENHPRSGNVGAGCGATVGKMCGMERATKTGLGIYAAQVGELKVAAVVVLNALGDIYDPKNGKKVAGLRGEDGSLQIHSSNVLYQISERTDLFNSNTTIGTIITNGKFSKAEMSKIARMAGCAYARCINPVGTMADGDTIYAAALGEAEADINVAGTLAAEVMSEAILRAAKSDV